MGQKKDYRHLMEAVSDICFGVAEVDFSANQVYVLHNQLRPHEVGCAFAYDEYLAKYVKDLGSEQDGFADLLTSEELLDSFVSGQTSIDINAYNCTIKIKFFIKDQSGHKIFFSNRNPKAQTQPRRDTEPGVGPKPLAQSVVPYGCGNDQLWVGSVGGNGASVSLSSTAGFTALQESASQNAAHLMSTPARPAAAPGSAPQSALEEVAPDQAAVRGGTCWDGVERRGVDPAYLTGLSPQDVAAAYTVLRRDKTETPAAYAQHPNVEGSMSLSNGRQKSDNDIIDLARSNFVTNVSVMFRHANIDPLPEWITQAATYDYAMHMLNAEHGKIRYMNRCMAVYRKRREALWSRAGAEKQYRMAMQVRKMLMEHFSAVGRDNVHELLRKAYIDNAVALVRHYLAIGNETQASAVAREAATAAGGIDAQQIAALARNPVPRPGAAQLIARHIIAPLRRSVSRLLPVPHAPR